VKTSGDIVMRADDNFAIYAKLAAGSPQVSRRLSIPTSGNARVHGTWYADSTIDTSDRRLKKDIVPLGIQLQKSRELVRGIPDAHDSLKEESAASWVLRELRPVSFTFKSTSDGRAAPVLPEGQRDVSAEGRLHFGFVAQEVQRVAPNLVMNDEGTKIAGSEPLSLIYQDLLAVLTLAVKEQQQQLSRQNTDVTQAQTEVTELLDAAEALERLLDMVEEAGPEAMEKLRGGQS